MTPDADDLLLFARVVESGSFSRAAERVGLPKSTVSRRIAELEKRLGERLLQRTTRKLVLTDFGRGVLDHARVLSEEVDAALAFALSRQARPSGRLRVSMPGDFASVALEGALAGFVRDYPEIALEIDLSPRRVDLIGENFDLAIRMGPLQDDAQLAARRLALFENGLYASPALLREHGEPLTPDALADMPGLMLLSRSGDAIPWTLTPTGGEGATPRAVGGGAANGASEVAPARAPVDDPPARAAADHGTARVVLPARHLRANSPELLLRLARSGAGVGSGSEFFARPYVARGELVRVLPDWCLPDSPAWAVFPGRRLMPAKTRAFIDALAAAMASCREEHAAEVAAALRERDGCKAGDAAVIPRHAQPPRTR